jgi:hypothetical protein
VSRYEDLPRPDDYGHTKMKYVDGTVAWALLVKYDPKSIIGAILPS